MQTKFAADSSDDVVLRIPRAAQALEQRQVFDAVGQNEVVIGENGVDAAGIDDSGWRPTIEGMGEQVIGVVAQAAVEKLPGNVRAAVHMVYQRVVAVAASEGVLTVETVQGVVAGQAGDRVGPGRAGQRVVARGSLDDVRSRLAGD